MTLSELLEQWATMYVPLSHKPDGKLEERSFFRLRYIDLDNTFRQNANILRSPLMLQSTVSTGEFTSARRATLSHQVWFVAKLKDTSSTLGRYSELQLQMQTESLMEMCEDLATYLLEAKSRKRCPITGRDFSSDPVLLFELNSISPESIGYGVMPDIYAGQWLIAGIDWKTLRPIQNIECTKARKYKVGEEEEESGGEEREER